jgi:signal transduction histidine kinase/tetratricopeptide (TPR) repeat protein
MISRTVKAIAFLLMAALFGTGARAASHGAPGDWAQFDALIAKSQGAMMADPKAALAAARAAETLANRHRDAPRYRESLATSLWLEAEAGTRINQVVQARTALQTALQIAASDGKTSKLDGDLALTRARLADSTGDYALALKSYQQAHSVFVKLGILRSQAIALLGIGAIYEKARDFDRELRYYREASQVYPGEPGFNLSVANNIGFALQQVGRYDEALKNYSRALKIAVSLKSPFLQAYILNNIAMSEAKLHRLAEAERSADQALKLLGPRDENGWAPFVWSAKADIAYQRGALKTAVADLDKAFHGTDLGATIAPFRDSHEIAYKIYRVADNYPLAMAHLEAFKRLDDEGRSVAASANIALSSAQFDFANQQLEIARLKSAQLERDIRLNESRAAMQTVIFAAALLSGLVLIAWIAWRHFLVRRHRNAITQKNVALTQTLAQRDLEIARRIEVESQLRFAVEAAQQASRAKSHFLANMSHELRTPLNAIIGFSEILAARAASQERTREYASSIVEGARHLLSVLTDILDMARIEAGKVALVEKPVRLGDLVEGTISAHRREASADGKNLRYVETEGAILVRADEARLRQVLENLTSNAIKFTDTGGTVEIRIERAPDGVDLVVADDGKGIPADKLNVIMEPFGQVESAYARAHGGTGLGLPIVKALVDLHGGRFTIGSNGERGTIARVHLPLERVLDAGDPHQTRYAAA